MAALGRGRLFILVGATLVVLHVFLPSFRSRLTSRPDSFSLWDIAREEPLAVLLIGGPQILAVLMGLGAARSRFLGGSGASALNALSAVTVSMFGVLIGIFLIGGYIMGFLKFDHETRLMAGLFVFLAASSAAAWRTALVPESSAPPGIKYLLCLSAIVLAASPMWELAILPVSSHRMEKLESGFWVGAAGWLLMLLGAGISIRALRRSHAPIEILPDPDGPLT